MPYTAREIAAMHAARAEAQLATASVQGIGGSAWTAIHADGTATLLSPCYVIPLAVPMAPEAPNFATPSDPAMRGYQLQAPAGSDVRLQDTITNGVQRFAVTAVAPYEHVVIAPLQEIAFYYTAELWRINPATGRRTPFAAGVRVNIFPGGESNPIEVETGQVGGRESYNGNAELGQDIKENDQLRNIVTASGLAWFPNARMTVTTVARWPAMLLLRMRNEAPA